MRPSVQSALVVSALAVASLQFSARAAAAGEPGRADVAVRYAAFDKGPAPDALPIRNMQIVLKMSAGQQRALQVFLADRGNPRSPGYHHWLTPEEFGARFGASDEAVARVQAWLAASGMTEVSVSRGRMFIVFSGTAGAVERAFACRMHVFEIDGRKHFANFDTPQLPRELGDAVGQVVGLDDFGARPQWVHAAQPEYVAASGVNALGPDDLATIYNTAALYGQGIDGSGITVAVLGQTPLGLSDYRAYRRLFGLAANDIQAAEFPGSGSGTGDADDQIEATLDLEAIGAIARGANILYVWGSTVEVAAFYVVDNQLAQVVSESYAGCETGGDGFFETLALQASAEGITWLAASGDSGAAGCDAMDAPAATLGLNVMVPASAPNVTAVGGTAFADGSSGEYWSARNNAWGGSALGYVPETGWSSSSAVLGGGGGASALFPKPGFQSDAEPAVTSGRLVPDVALAAATAPVPYVIVYGGSPTLVGGTSAATPVFAGIAGLVNEYLLTQGDASAPGLGNINPVLYLLAEQTPAVFHDVVAGSNDVPCTISTPDCTTGTLGYAAGPGYDEATGLGSVDAYALASNWASAVLEPSSTSLSVSSNGSQAEQAVSLAAEVTAGEAPLEGSPVVFYYSNAQFQPCETMLGSVVTDATGKAVLATSLLPSGTNTIFAVATGTTEVAPSPDSNAVTIAVAPIPTTIAIAPSSGPYQTGQTATLSVSVTGTGVTALAGNLLFPMGTVSLYDGAGNLEASATLSNSGAANLTTAALAAGPNNFYVSYSGSAYAAASRSASVVINASAQPADFTLSGSGAVSLMAGSSVSSELIVTPVNGFNQTIALSCTGLPAGYTCNLPANLTPAGATSATVTFVSPSTGMAATMPLTFLLVFLVGAHKRLRPFAALLAVALAVTLTGGCAAVNPTGGSSSAQSSQSFLATITASSAAIVHQLTVQVTVKQ